MSLPSSMTLPVVGPSKPAITLSVVVLPQPEGPRRLRNSPSAMTRSMPLRPMTPPGKCLETPCRLRSASLAIENSLRLLRIDPDDDTALRSGIAEGMQKRALESEAVAGLEQVSGLIDHKLDRALRDDAEFMSAMGIGLGGAAAGLDRNQHAG